MEAWDTLAAVEDGLAALGRLSGMPAAVEHLVVVTHRLRGSAALSGFPQVAALAAAMEETVERTAASPAQDQRALAALSDLVLSLKTALDVIGVTGVEDGEAITEALDRIVPAAPAEPDTETTRRLTELDRFFTDQPDVLEYFVPEAVEHLESMAQSLVALEGDASIDAEIAALFRAVHTLKGAAYTVGCRMIGDLTHRIEDMLGEIRDHHRPLSRGAIETVFAGLDALRLLVRSGDDRADGRAAVYDRAIALLDALPMTEAPPAGAPAMDTSVPAFETASAAAPSAPVIAEAAPRLEPVTAARGPVRPPRGAGPRRIRPSIRVSLDRLDALMNRVGELGIARSRLERHPTAPEQARDG